MCSTFTIFSNGSIIPLSFKFTELHALTLAVRSYALLLIVAMLPALFLGLSTQLSVTCNRKSKNCVLDNLYSCFTAHIASLVSRHFCSLDCIQQVKGQFAAVLLNVLCWTQITYTLEHQMHIHMAVPDRNRILFHRVFRVHFQVWHTVISLCILLDLFPGLPHLACLIHKPVSGRTVGRSSASMYYVEYYVHDEHQCTRMFTSVAPTFNYMKFLPTFNWNRLSSVTKSWVEGWQQG